MLLAGYKPTTPGAPGPASTVPPITVTEERRQEEALVALTQIPTYSEKELELMKDDAKRQQQYHTYTVRVDDENRKYREERAALEGRFYNTLEKTYTNLINKLAGGPMSNQPGAGRRFGQSMFGSTFEKLGVKLFGQDTGREMGQIFTELAGSYTDQFIAQVVGPSLFGGNVQQANRFFNSMASGNKKHAMEDLIFGMTGVRTGMRSVIGYETGAAQLAKDLALVTGTPFSAAFNIGNDSPNQVLAGAMGEQFRVNVTDPIVEAQYKTAEMIIDNQNGISKEQRDEMTRERNRFESQQRQSTGGGGVVRDAQGNVIAQSRAAAQGRLADFGFNLFNYGAGRGISRALGVSDNPILNTVVQGMVGEFTGAARAGTSFDVVGSLGRTLGVNLPPGASLLEVGMALNSMYSAIPNAIGSMVGAGASWLGTASGATYGTGFMTQQSMQLAAQEAGMGAAAGSTAASIGQAATMLGNAVIGYTISKTLSGGYSAGKWVDAAAAIGAVFFGPIAGVVGGLFNRAFGRKAPVARGMGIAGTLGEEQSDIRNYVDMFAKGGWFKSDKSWTEYSAASPKLVKSMTEQAKAMTTAIRTIAKQMGLGRIDTTGPFQSQLFVAKRGVFTSKAVELPQEILNGLKAGQLARLPDGTIIRTTEALTTTTNNYGYYDSDSGMSYLIDTTKTITGIRGEILPANVAYGLAYNKLREQFSMEIGKLNLKDMDEEQQAEAIENLFKAYGDSFISNAFGTLLDKFQKDGERLYETFDRLSAAMVNFDERMAMLNYTFDGLYQITDLFEVAATKDIFIDLYGGMEKFMNGTQQFFDLFYTEEEKLRYFEDVGRRKMQEALEEAGLEAEYSVEGLLGGMGNTLDDARKAYRAIVDKFVQDNQELLAKNDPETVKQLAALHGDLAASYYTAADSIIKLNEQTSYDKLKGIWETIFDVTGATGATPEKIAAANPQDIAQAVSVSTKEVVSELKDSGMIANQTVNIVAGNNSGNAQVNNSTNNNFVGPVNNSSSANRVVSPTDLIIIR
jgi:hypothetical protein